MLDIKWIRENPEQFDQAMIKRGLEPLSEKILSLDLENRQNITLVQQLQASRNSKSKTLGNISDKTSKEFEDARRDVNHINEKLNQLLQAADINQKLDDILDTLPNLLDEDVPNGKDESMNVEIRKQGLAVSAEFHKQHFELGENLEMMDFLQTAKISGSRFVTLKGDLAKLERALINFMLDIHVKNGFSEISPPYIVKNHAMYNTGQLPKFAEDSFATTNGYRLIPTAEVPLVNLVADHIIPRESLPIRFVSYTPCFRSEAGSAGRDTRGMIRLHQFGKVELVSITAIDESRDEHEYLLNMSESILQALELPYRVALLCSGDTGFAAKKTYDLEVWLPGQKMYREIASCSNCGDFQARRMKARYKEFGQNDTKFVHTLNTSALPIGRAIVAILENYQNPDGSIAIPKQLVPYMSGMTKITKC